MMDLRRLEVFCTLMEKRSFSKTAGVLSLTQPTVSGHIKSLEQEIGLTLFDRHKRQVQPTSAAFVLLEYAQRILALRGEAGFALERFKGRIGGHLNLGGSTIPGAYILPAIIGKFHQLYPETHFHLILDDTVGIVNRVASGDIEAGVVGADLKREILVFEPLMDDEMILAAPPDYPFAKSRAAVSLRDLVTAPFIIREKGSGTRSTMLEAMAHQGSVSYTHLRAHET